MNSARRTVNSAATPDMICSKQIVRLLLCGLCMVIALASAAPDSGGHVPLPGPGLSYGGIPYGSVSGNVAEYFKRQPPSSGASAGLTYAADHADQWL